MKVKKKGKTHYDDTHNLKRLCLPLLLHWRDAPSASDTIMKNGWLRPESGISVDLQ